MKTLKAHIENGRVVVDEPVDLPEGTPLELRLYLQGTGSDDEDGLDDEERAALDASIERGWNEYKSGAQSVSAEEFIAKLRSRG